MREEKDNFVSKDHVKENSWVSEIMELAKLGGELPLHTKEIDEYTCSSVIKFPFQDVDFGWGRPAAVTIANGP